MEKVELLKEICLIFKNIWDLLLYGTPKKAEIDLETIKSQFPYGFTIEDWIKETGLKDIPLDIRSNLHAKIINGTALYHVK